MLFQNQKIIKAKWEMSGKIFPKKITGRKELKKTISQPLFKFEYSKNYFHYGQTKGFKFVTAKLNDLLDNKSNVSQ